jgi:ABC-type branched-subunit amino acid transport system substrate-binding protein
MKVAAVAALTALVLVGCGQKPGVSTQASGSLPPGVTFDPETGQYVDAEGNVVGGSGDFGTGTGTGDFGTGDTGTGTDGSTDPNAPGTDPNAPGTDPNNPGTSPGGSSSEGVTATSIKVGSHAPLTGAAPVPSDSAVKGSKLYWEWLKEQKQDIHGRYVEALLKNDNYNPSQAVAVCKEMVEQDKVFMLSGAAGTDQIQACARYAASVGVPYMSAGVTEVGLTGLPNYFAISMTYPDQGPLLADYIQTKLGGRGEKNGILYFDTPNFQDAHDAFVSAMRSKGMPLAYDRGVCKCATQTEAQTVVQEMNAAGIENVYVLTSPVWWLQVLQSSRTQNYTPQWTGVGITKTFDTIAAVGCRNGTINGSRFFSPFPAHADIDKYDPDFKKAVQAIYPEENNGQGDDFMILGWAAAKVGGELFERAGKNLTRGGFIESTANAKNVKTGTMPVLNYTASDRYGASTTTVAEAKCSDAKWHTIQTYTSNF